MGRGGALVQRASEHERIYSRYSHQDWAGVVIYDFTPVPSPPLPGLSSLTPLIDIIFHDRVDYADGMRDAARRDKRDARCELSKNK
jgi:hypothetical protein